MKMAAAMNMECGDFLEFQDALKKMRILDDKIIYMLNTSIPTDSFKGQVDPSSTCKELFDQVADDSYVFNNGCKEFTVFLCAVFNSFKIIKQLKINYENRELAIKRCITVSADKVRGFREQREKNDDSNLLKTLRKEQTKLRLLQAELNVEEVVKERTTKVYYERCRPFYKPPDLSV